VGTAKSSKEKRVLTVLIPGVQAQPRHGLNPKSSRARARTKYT
jgi:hypothetical protein